MEETNEQYFDRLAKGTGRETTPGFREWILASMEELGERPSDAELSMMHLAYQAGADTARAEVEKLRAENRDLDNLQSELHDAYQKVSDWNKELLSLVAECRPVVEAVRKAQANSCCDKACAHCGEMLRMKLPAMEGGE